MSNVHHSELLDVAQFFADNVVSIQESISRSRNTGMHDRHFASQTQFTTHIASVATLISGAQLQFIENTNTYYGISLEHVTSFRFEVGIMLEIIEQFEQETERRTYIHKIN